MRRILIVDDDGTTVEGLRLLLVSDGYEVAAHSRAADALAALEHGRYDAVITDLEMPGVHGLEVVRAARATSPEAVILVVSAYNASPATVAARAAGAARCFAKPVQYEALADDLAARLGR
jgi:CheY-like chemotaxis protein